MESDSATGPLMQNENSPLENSSDNLVPRPNEQPGQPNEPNSSFYISGDSSFVNTFSSPPVYIEPTWTIDLPSVPNPAVREPNRDFSGKSYSDLNLKHPPAPRINPLHLRLLKRIRFSADRLCSCGVELNFEGVCDNPECENCGTVVNKEKYEEFQNKIAEDNADVMERWNEELDRLNNL